MRLSPACRRAHPSGSRTTELRFPLYNQITAALHAEEDTTMPLLLRPLAASAVPAVLCTGQMSDLASAMDS